MKKFIPEEKLGKKEKRKLNSAKRKNWGALSPVTRRPENPKAYNRKKPERMMAACFLSGFLIY